MLITISVIKNWLLKYVPIPNTKGYKPMLLDTDSLWSAESSIYPSLALSDHHLPYLLKRRSGTPAFAATVAPPTLRLCSQNSTAGYPNSVSFFLKSSQNVLQPSYPGALSFSPVLVLMIGLNKNSEAIMGIYATCK